MNSIHILESGCKSDPSSLFLLCEEAEKTSAEVKQHLESWGRRFVLGFFGRRGFVPDYVRRHILATQALNQTVKVFQETNESLISPAITKTLEESQALLRQVSHKIQGAEFLNALIDSRKTSSLDQHHLLTPGNHSNRKTKIPESHYEWYLHLGLLMNIYQRIEDDELKKEIACLALNYLAKAAPYCFDELSLNVEVANKLNNMFDHGLIEPGIAYNRESPIFDQYLYPIIQAQVAPASGNQLFVIGTKLIEDLLPIWFSMIQIKGSGKEEEEKLELHWAEEIERFVGPHLEHAATHDFNDYIEPPLFIDFTLLLEDLLFTAGDSKKNNLFQQKLDSLEERLDHAVNIAAEKLQTKFPRHFQTDEERQRLLVFLRSNITGICRGQMKGFGFLKILPLFESSKYLSLPPNVYILEKFISKGLNFTRYLTETNFLRAKVNLNNFINGTGIRISCVEGRKELLEFIPLEELLELNQQTMASYCNFGPNIQFYQNPSDITKTEVFERFKKKLSDPELLQRQPHLKALGGSTVNLIQGLLMEIDHKKWTLLNDHSEKRQIIQTCLFRLLQHVAKAENYLEDFNQFTRAIELVYYEMTTLLKLFSPFNAEDFAPIYTQQIHIIPEELRDFVKAGLTKSSMNTLAGMMAILSKMFDHPHRVIQKAAHFEIVLSMEKDQSWEQAVANPLDQIHLYVCDINHNINFDPHHSEYKASDVIEEIEALLKKSPNTDSLTIALDCTIDLLNSKKVQEVLAHFTKEILEGKLNFVIFRSGQKFDLSGMDHQYGSPFYMTNNGHSKWKRFEELMTQEVYKTDLLSTQWFCLSNKYASQEIDAYRDLIFTNTRKILDRIPSSLKPGNHPQIKVSTVDKGMDCCFIDIKTMGENANHISEKLKHRLYQKFAEKNKKMHTRGGYGYYAPNICFFPEHVIRINPGADQRDAELIIEFLEETAEVFPS